MYFMYLGVGYTGKKSDSGDNFSLVPFIAYETIIWRKNSKKTHLKKVDTFFRETKFREKRIFPYFIKEISNICWGYAIDLKFGQDSFVLMK